MEEEGLAASVYISDAPERIDNIYTFPSSFLNGKQNEYYLIISSALQQNAHENEKYFQYGYKDEKDILWMRHLPIACKQAEKYDNKLQSESDINVMFTGWSANVSIGKNVKFPKNKNLVIPNDSIVQIGDNVNINGCDIALSQGSEIRVSSNVLCGGMKIFLNIDGGLNIGEGSTFGWGLIRSGRNRFLIWIQVYVLITLSVRERILL